MARGKQWQPMWRVRHTQCKASPLTPRTSSWCGHSTPMGSVTPVASQSPSAPKVRPSRGANRHGILGAPACPHTQLCPFSADTSPTPQVSPELRVAVHLQEPVVLPPGAVRLAWTVSVGTQRVGGDTVLHLHHPPHLPCPQVEPPSPSVQGYQVLYRRRGGRWEAWDVRAPGERGALLTGLRHGQDYEVKVRPFYLHLHGPDSAVRALRMPEAGECWAGGAGCPRHGMHCGRDVPRPAAPSAPPRAVSVAGNGTSVRISWQPPPPAEQNGVILDYRVSGACRSRILPHPIFPSHVTSPSNPHRIPHMCHIHHSYNISHLHRIPYLQHIP